MYRVFYTVILFNAAVTIPQMEEGRGNINNFNEDRWEWGYFDVTGIPSVAPNTSASPRAAFNESTTVSPEMETETEPSYCQPYNPVKPDFSKPDRRISDEKCYEYIWELKVRLNKKERFSQCAEYKRKKYNVYYAIGGFPTGPGDYPHMGAIGWKASVGTWVFKCGSTLISEKFVLTAAHCARASSRDSSIADPVPKIVRLGDKNIIDIPYRYVNPEDRNITRIIVHPQFSPPKKYFDIALMELDEEVQFSRLLQPACLWTKPDISSLGKAANLTGWGVVETGSRTISPELLQAKVDILDSQLCDDLLKPYCNRNWCGIKDDELCAGKLAGGVDACQGDSGGPLQVQIPLPTTEEGRMHYVFGVISFGIGCAYPNLPGIYTRVSTFIDWIEDNVWKNETK